MDDDSGWLEFRYAPRPDITEAEWQALRPYLVRRTLPAVDYYRMGSEARHLLVGPALCRLTWSN
jgi:hypothetical protein